jgi:cytochrome c
MHKNNKSKQLKEDRASLITLFARSTSMVSLALLTSCSSMTQAQRDFSTPNLGKPPTQQELSIIDISIKPDGDGLPTGSGNVELGKAVYTAKCLSCHGDNGIGKPADALVGGIGSLATNKPIRTVGSYWPYSTTLFDYIRRAMPLNAPKSLSNNEVYALSAYILYLNGIVTKDIVLNSTNLASIQMPNRNGFIDESNK